MPWKGEKDPYRIWLSEVILQQTRVEQGLGYYRRFVQQYPTIQALAAASDQEVMKLWEGLGYYSRCRNLLATAREISARNEGRFPDHYADILALKGVGPYIAAAIASFAYNLPYAVLDGNVFRVLSRVYGIELPIDTTEGKKAFSRIADENLDRGQPGIYNQAIMDFGATVCKPMVPACNSCPMKTICRAYNEGLVNHLPLKQKTLQRKTRWIYYFVFSVDDRLLVHQRPAGDIWQDLYEFYPFESESSIDWDAEKLKAWMKDQFGLRSFKLLDISAPHRQQLTHQEIQGQFFRIALSKLPRSLEHYRQVTAEQRKALPFPRFINHYLEQFEKLKGTKN